jgi:Protein of unknown function (DUF2798)
MLRAELRKECLTIPLDPASHFGPHRGGRKDRGIMEGKAKFIFPVLATGFVVFVVSSVVTFTNIGFRADFVHRWLSAFVVGWPVGAATALLAFPFLRLVATSIAGLIERT